MTWRGSSITSTMNLRQSVTPSTGMRRKWRLLLWRLTMISRNWPPRTKKSRMKSKGWQAKKKKRLLRLDLRSQSYHASSWRLTTWTDSVRQGRKATLPSSTTRPSSSSQVLRTCLTTSLISRESHWLRSNCRLLVAIWKITNTLLIGLTSPP